MKTKKKAVARRFTPEMKHHMLALLPTLVTAAQVWHGPGTGATKKEAVINAALGMLLQSGVLRGADSTMATAFIGPNIDTLVSNLNNK